VKKWCLPLDGGSGAKGIHKRADAGVKGKKGTARDAGEANASRWEKDKGKCVLKS
jgi:hypothetical protein